jgi:hypothetical protein
MATAEGTERQARRQRDKALADDLGTAAPSGRINSVRRSMFTLSSKTTGKDRFDDGEISII